MSQVIQFVEENSHVVHSTGFTSTVRMLSVLANSTMTVRNMTSQLSGFSQSCNLHEVLNRRMIPFLK